MKVILPVFSVLYCSHFCIIYCTSIVYRSPNMLYISTALCFVGCQYPELYIFTRFPDCSLIIPFVFKRTQHIEYKKQKRNIYAVMYHTSPYQISHARILVCSTIVVVGGGQKYNRHYLFFLGKNIYVACNNVWPEYRNISLRRKKCFKKGNSEKLVL